jgi:hypothetical protein
LKGYHWYYRPVIDITGCLRVDDGETTSGLTTQGTVVGTFGRIADDRWDLPVSFNQCRTCPPTLGAGPVREGNDAFL